MKTVVLIVAMMMLAGCGSGGGGTPAPAANKQIAEMAGTWQKASGNAALSTVIIIGDTVTIFPSPISGNYIRGYYNNTITNVVALDMNNWGTPTHTIPSYKDEVAVTFSTNGNSMIWSATANTMSPSLYPVSFTKLIQ